MLLANAFWNAGTSTGLRAGTVADPTLRSRPSCHGSAPRRSPNRRAEHPLQCLITRLAEVVGYRIIPERNLIEAARQQKQRTYDACYDEACQIELGKAAAAEKVIDTKILRVGDVCVLSSKVIDLRTEITERAASTDDLECSEGALFQAVRVLVDRLAR